MNKRFVYFNGKFVEEKDAKISIYDSALMFGDMVFEMTRSFNKKQFKLREHLERLYLGLKILKIEINMSIEQLEKACLETVEKNNPYFGIKDEHRLLINVSRGPLSIYHHAFTKVEPTIIIADFPLKWTVASMAHLFDQGINFFITSQRAIPAHLMDPKIKNRSRMWYQMANIEVSNLKGDDNWALLLDTDGFISEGTGCNFFIIKDKKIITPLGKDLLRGISRQYIFELSEQLGLECIEKNIEPYDVYASDEAFVTATPFCILPVRSLNNILIQNGKMGNITNMLLKKWSENVEVDIVEQIKEFGKEVESHDLKGATPYQFKK